MAPPPRWSGALPDTVLPVIVTLLMFVVIDAVPDPKMPPPPPTAPADELVPEVLFNILLPWSIVVVWPLLRAEILMPPPSCAAVLPETVVLCRATAPPFVWRMR